MIFEKTDFAGLFVSFLDKKEDERGFFSRFYCFEEFKNLGVLNNIAQANISHNKKKYTFRGMHYQIAPHEETKIISCLKGSFIDYVIDLRREEPSYLKSFQIKLTENDKNALIIPKGFAHGFFTLEDDTEAFYLVDEPFSPGAERGIKWDDPLFKLILPVPPEVISEKDTSWKNFNQKK